MPPKESKCCLPKWFFRELLPLFGLACVVANQPTPCAAAEKASAAAATSKESADEAAIRRSANEFVDAFNLHDAKAVARLWTENGEFVDETGKTYHGRQAIEELYAKYFREHPKAEIEVSVDSIRRVNAMKAVEDGTAKLTSAPTDSKYVAIHVKQADGSWLLGFVRESPKSAPATSKNLEHLDYLVGEWTADHGDTEVDLAGHWNDGKSFVERRFIATRDGKVVSSSLEIVGWDPVSGQVTSWSFSSDGGRAKGTWKALEDGWVIQNSGVTADGTPTAAIDVWAPLRDGALGWRSTHRSVGGTPVKESKHVVLTKKEAKDTAKKETKEKAPAEQPK